ncbi:hypothetical protein [Streptomyces radicis]|uniref:Uncharacterized protein n=1 Tax=Streptomyces radicis TaxID=1750517 RepID=A0A3A9W1E5_9ACTN|nr:hypothetical protein [Streptomyces radicis]RKN06679.1 hypothetical protein D7319_21430 [Streptomyces radicis]RKN19304.1 hypothetical protein D7318_20895 [Streptomyces radicis]
MLALRLARGSAPLALLRRLLLAGAAGCVAFLLLAALAHAAADPVGGRASVLRLAWCAVPLAATVQLAVAVARADPSARPRAGLAVAGMGPARLPALAAASAAVAALLGTGLALLVFLHLRGDLGGLPLDGAAAGALAAGEPLPLGGMLTLLAVVPGAAAAAGALAVRRPEPPRRDLPPVGDPAAVARATPPTPAPAGLPWGTALATAGIALCAYGGDDAPATPADGWLPVTGQLGGVAAGVVGGWLLIAAGIVLAGPGVVHLSGMLLCAGRPGVMRLLAGRTLQDESRRLGRPLGALAAAGGALLAAVELDGLREFGPLGTLGTGVVLACALGTVATVADDARAARRSATATLLRLGAPRGMLRGAAALRAATLLGLLLPLTWLTTFLLTLPAGG